MQEKNFSWLLVALLVFLIGVPVLDGVEAISPRVSRALMLSWLVSVGIWSLRGFGRRFTIGVAFAAASVVFNFLAASLEAAIFDYVALTAIIGFLLTAILCTLRQVALGTEISANRLVGAISIYLMLGVLWALAYTETELAVPGSFSGVAAGADQTWDSDWLYFSFVTMTTLGYGDLLPVSAPARILAYMQAVFGQFYIAILVAGLVGAYIAGRPVRGPDD